MSERVIDIGGLVEPEPRYKGRRLVVFAVDPGVTTGWCALSVPVGLLSGLGVARTLARAGWRYGQISRPSSAEQPLDFGDTNHVTDILNLAGEIYQEWMDHDYKGTVSEDVFVFVFERFDLRLLSSDPSLLAPVRVNALLHDRLQGGGDEEERWGLPVFMQSASDAKNTVTDARLKRMAMYDEHSGPHARDATRHAILFVRRFVSTPSIQEVLEISLSL